MIRREKENFADFPNTLRDRKSDFILPQKMIQNWPTCITATAGTCIFRTDTKTFKNFVWDRRLKLKISSSEIKIDDFLVFTNGLQKSKFNIFMIILLLVCNK